MKELGYYNGQVGPMEEIKIPMTDRALFFGDGVYEVAPVVYGKAYGLRDHIDRFFNSFQAIRIPFEQTKEELEALLQSLIDRMDPGIYLLYWQLSRGSGKRTHSFPPAGTKPNLLAYLTPHEMKPLSRDYRLITVEDTRYYHCNVKTINLLPNVMASQAAKEAGCHEAVFHRGDTVTEGSHTNILILKDGVLQTMPLGNLILPGVTRKHLFEIAGESGIPIREASFTVREMMEADEVLVSSSSGLFNAACQIDGRPVGGKAPELLKALQAGMMERFNREVGCKVF